MLTMKTLNKRYIQGAPFVEVMISVFVLTFGILALMLTQIRSVASIAQAENQTLIAQAAEALAEGMQVNPTLNFKIVGGKKVLDVQYAAYKKSNEEISGTKTFKKLSDLTSNSKQDLADLQLGNFEAALQQLPDIEQIHYSICQDKETPDEPEMTAAGVFNDNCDAGGSANGAVIKVGWVMANASKQGEKTTFTYMLKVKG